MWTFLIAGIVYLVGVGIMLYVRPSSMFAPDGSWKEFGIGKSKDSHTPFPFWLFCLTWAIVAYTTVVFLSWMAGSLSKQQTLATETTDLPNSESNTNESLRVQPLENNRLENNRKINNSIRNRNTVVDPEDFTDTSELLKGYYILNKKASKQAGKPKYVYFGPIEPKELQEIKGPIELEEI
jgi:hypothetical protein